MEGYEKLVRDNIPDILDKKGIPYERKIASPEEYRTALIQKLAEEVQEFTEAGGSPEELADVLEVVDALKKLPEYQEVLKLQEQKRTERGGFEKRIILKGEK